MRIQTLRRPNLYLPATHDYYYNPNDPLLLPTYVLSTPIGSRAREVHIEIVENDYYQRQGLDPISISSLPLSEHEEAVLDELLPTRESSRAMRTLKGSNYHDFIEQSLQEYSNLQRKLSKSNGKKSNLQKGKKSTNTCVFWRQNHQKFYLPI